MKTYIVEYDGYNPYESFYALVSDDAEILTPFKYEYLSSLDEDRFSAIKCNKYIILDQAGNEIEIVAEQPKNQMPMLGNSGDEVKKTLEEKFATIDKLQKEGSFDDMFRPLYANDTSRIFWVKKEGKVGYLNDALDIVIPFDYEDGTAFYFNRAFVKKDGLWSLIDESGGEIVVLEEGCSPRWYGKEAHIGHLYIHGLMMVEKEGKVGIIDRKGKQILPYSEMHAASVKQGVIRVDRGDIYSMKGEPISVGEYDFIGVESYKDVTYFRVKKGERMGILNSNLEEVIPLEHESLGYINELGFMVSKTAEGAGAIDMNGNTILPFEYESTAEDRYGERHQYFLRCRGEDDVDYFNLESGKFYRAGEFHDMNAGGWSSWGLSGLLSVQFGKFGYGKIRIDKDDVWYEDDAPIPDAKLHKVALGKLKSIIEAEEKLDAKIVRKLFKSVYYWSASWLEEIAPHIDASNVFVIEELLTFAVKKAYGKQILAGGVPFFDLGLSLVQTFNPDIYSDFSNQLLDLSKKADKKTKVLEAIENNVREDQVDALSLSTKKLEADKPKITTIAKLWQKEKTGIYSEFEKLKAELDKVDAIFQNPLASQVDAFFELEKEKRTTYLQDVKALEKLLGKVAKKLKTDAAKEIRDVFVVFRAWLEKRGMFKSEWLNPPATESELQTLQDKILAPLPLSFVESYKICNGVSGREHIFYMNGGDLLFSSIQQIISECKNVREYATNFVHPESRKEKLDEEVKNWVPIFSSNGNVWIMNLGNTLHSDFSRPITKGAVFDYNHEDGNLEEIRVAYSSFKRVIEDLSFAHDL